MTCKLIANACRENIGMAVLQLLEDGFLQKLMKKWWYDKGECAVEDGTVRALFELHIVHVHSPRMQKHK